MPEVASTSGRLQIQAQPYRVVPLQLTRTSSINGVQVMHPIDKNWRRLLTAVNRRANFLFGGRIDLDD
nr:unnamed protein product [Spirometra erinaceieuropaei]